MGTEIIEQPDGSASGCFLQISHLWVHKIILRIPRKTRWFFVRNSEIMLDIWLYAWYIIQARVGDTMRALR